MEEITKEHILEIIRKTIKEKTLTYSIDRSLFGTEIESMTIWGNLAFKVYSALIYSKIPFIGKNKYYIRFDPSDSGTKPLFVEINKNEWEEIKNLMLQHKTNEINKEKDKTKNIIKEILDYGNSES